MKKTILTLLTITLFATAASAEDVKPEKQYQPGAIYATTGILNMDKNAAGSGLSYGAGFKRGCFGMEIYSIFSSTMKKGMDKQYSDFGGGGRKTGEAVISEPGFGFDFNFYLPIFKRLEVYAGPSLGFEKVADIYVSDGSWSQAGGAADGERYVDGNGIWKTRINGQAGLMAYVPFGKINLAINAGYSTFRGVTIGAGLAF